MASSTESRSFKVLGLGVMQSETKREGDLEGVLTKMRPPEKAKAVLGKEIETSERKANDLMI